MVEDEDSKIRRNLVAVATVILLLAWLDVPLSSVAARVLGEKPDSPSFVLPAWKVWLAALALLSYCFIRYNYSDEAVKGSAALVEARGVQFAKRIDAYFAGLATDFEKGRLRDDELRQQLQSLIYQTAQARRREDCFKGAKVHAKFKRDHKGLGNRGLDHQLMLFLSFDGEGIEGPNMVQGSFRFSMEPAINRKLNLRANIEAALLSKGAVAHTWPLGLAALALVVLIWKLGRAIIAAWLPQYQ